jgi:hypothetical protein
VNDLEFRESAPGSQEVRNDACIAIQLSDVAATPGRERGADRRGVAGHGQGLDVRMTLEEFVQVVTRDLWSRHDNFPEDALEICESVVFHSGVVMLADSMVKDEIRDLLIVEKNHEESADTETDDRMVRVSNVTRGQGSSMRLSSRLHMHPPRSREVQNLLGRTSKMATRILNNAPPTQGQ